MTRLGKRLGLVAFLPAVLCAVACGSAAATTAKAHLPTPTPAAARGTPAPRRSPTPFAARSAPTPSTVPAAGIPATGGAPNPAVTAAAIPYPAATDPPEPLATVSPPAPPASATPNPAAPATPLPPAARNAAPAPSTGGPAAGPGANAASGLAVSAAPPSAVPPRVVASSPAVASLPPLAPRPGGTAAAAQADAPLEDLFQAVSVKELDLPFGFRETLASTKPPLYLGQSASFYAHFSRPAQAGSATPAVVGVVLLAFPDEATAAARMRSGRAQINSYLTSGGGQHVEQASGPALGDESVDLHLLRVSDGVGKSDGGYEVMWRRGRVVGVVIETGTPEPRSIDDAAAIAQQQDQNLADAGI